MSRFQNNQAGRMYSLPLSFTASFKFSWKGPIWPNGLEGIILMHGNERQNAKHLSILGVAVEKRSFLFILQFCSYLCKESCLDIRRWRRLLTPRKFSVHRRLLKVSLIMICFHLGWGQCCSASL